LKQIEHLPSRLSVETERAFIAGINSGCRFPVGALATYDTPSNTIRLRAKAFSVDGKKTLRIMMNGMATRREEIGYAAAKRFRKNGIEKLASEWRETLNSWFKI
jgi:hydroxymethylbilane synthase